MSREFADFVVEQMAGLGDVTARRMFGGWGIFHGGLMFALIADDVLYFKVDDHTEPDFEAQGLPRFTYRSKQRETSLRYRQAPEQVFDDPEEMASQAQTAFDVAQRAASQR